MSDPYWASVVLLAVNDSKANGTTSFADQSISAHTLTANGNVQYSTASAPTGLSSSALFDGTGDFISSVDSADWTLSADLTIEVWTNTIQGTAFAALIGQTSSAALNSGDWILDFNSVANNGKLMFWQADFSNAAALMTGTVSIRDGLQHHVAVTRSGNNWNIWADGASDASVTQAVTWGNSAQSLLIGRQNGVAARDYNGNVAAVRITKGVARYTGAFTVPSLPFSTSSGSIPMPLLHQVIH